MLHPTLIYKSYNKRRKKYTKFNHEILYTKFLIKKVTPYSERTTRRTKNFTPNLFFFTKSEKIYTKHQHFYTKLEIFYTKPMALLGFRRYALYVSQDIFTTCSKHKTKLTCSYHQMIMISQLIEKKTPIF